VGLSTSPGPEGAEIAFTGLINALRVSLIGQDPIDNERLWATLWQPKFLGRRGYETRVISALDIAIWDLKAKSFGQPLYRVLGGAKSSIPYYVAGGYYEEGKSLEDLAAEMRACVAGGAGGVKMKVGRATLHEDAERVKLVREVVGPKVKLMVDANCAYSPSQAIAFARLIEDLDIYWFEEPISSDDYRGLRRVADGTIIPIAAGENEYTRYGFRDLIDSGGVAVINADAQILGGISEFMKVAAYAQAHNIAVAPHGNQEIHVHLVAALTNGLIVEFYDETTNPMWRTFLVQPLIGQDGFLKPPDREGLGIEVNHQALKSYQIL
jgi:D-arabinonate dehydratase